MKKSFEKKEKMATRKKRILFALPGLHVGGIEKHLLKQFAHFNQNKYELHLLTFFYINGSPDLFEQVPSFVKMHRFKFSFGLDIRNTWKLLKYLRELQPDLVVSSMVFPNTIMRLLKPLVAYKIIAREHNTYTDKKFRHKLRDHVCSYFSDGIVAVSNMVADHASKQAKIPRDKFTVIQNGVDLDEIEKYKEAIGDKVEKLYQEFKLAPDTRIILNVARLKPQKNHTLLIDAFALFVKEHPGYVLFILGSGADGDKLRQKISAMNLEKNVFLAGYRDDVYTFYTASDFFILTSDIEGFPNVAVEAMAFGLPVLSTMVSGINELIEDGHNGYILERDSKSICDTMVKITTAPPAVRERLVGEAVKKVQNYSIEENVRKYEELFDSVIEHENN